MISRPLDLLLDLVGLETMVSTTSISYHFPIPAHSKIAQKKNTNGSAKRRDLSNESVNGSELVSQDGSFRNFGVSTLSGLLVLTT